MRPSYASLCSVSNVFFGGETWQTFLQCFSHHQLVNGFNCWQRFTNQPIVFCVLRPTLNSFALAKWAVSLFSSRPAALVSCVSQLCRSCVRELLSLNLKKKRDCSQSRWCHIASNTYKSQLKLSTFYLWLQQLLSLCVVVIVFNFCGGLCLLEAIRHYAMTLSEWV